VQSPPSVHCEVGDVSIEKARCFVWEKGRERGGTYLVVEPARHHDEFALLARLVHKWDGILRDLTVENIGPKLVLQRGLAPPAFLMTGRESVSGCQVVSCDFTRYVLLGNL